MSDVWEDLGNTSEKPSKALKGLLSRSPPKWEHEPEEITAQRRARNLEEIFKVFDSPVLDASGLVTAEKNGKKFDFHPASDTYFIYSTQKYGTGIKRLIEQMIRQGF